MLGKTISYNQKNSYYISVMIFEKDRTVPHYFKMTAIIVLFS